MHHVLDITKSLAYHGFKKIILLNGHGSNMPNLDLVARRTNLETDAECVLVALVEPADGGQGRSCRAGGRASSPAAAPRLRAGDVAVPLPRRRQRPQGPDQERHDQLQRGGQPVQLGRPVRGRARRRSSRGRAATPRPACSATRSWRRAEKGRQAYEEAVKQLVRFVTWFKDRPEGRPQGPPPQAADDADPVGPAAAVAESAASGSEHEDRRPPPHRPLPAAPSRAAGPRNSSPRTTSTPSSRSSPTRASSASAAPSPAAPRRGGGRSCCGRS